MRRQIKMISALLSVLGWLVSCGASDDPAGSLSVEERGSTSMENASTSAGTTADPGDPSGVQTGSTVLNGAVTPLPETVLEPNASAQTPDGTLDPEKACAGLVLEPESLSYREPVAMYIVLDNSGSMKRSDGPISKWDQAKTALTEFVTDPSSEGIDVGIQYFHPIHVGDDVNECDGMAHAQSSVEVGRLPEVALAVIASLAEAGPGGITPTVGALTGGIEFCKNFQQERPDEQCVVVFVTDGQPNGCGLDEKCVDGATPDTVGHCVDPESAAVLTPISSGGLSAGVISYTVGMQGVTEDGFELLNALAVAGGTDCTPNTPGKEACDVSETGGAGLLEALGLIRDTIVETTLVPCSWALPAAPDGKSLEPSLVNVSLEINGQPLKLGQVLTETDCATVEGGWYYDNAAAPNEIRTCPQTCNIVEANPHSVRAAVEIGCATKIAVPK